MKIDKEKIVIEKLNLKDIDKYIEFVEKIKENMEHKDWLGDFTKEDYEYLLSNGSLIYIWKYNDIYVASGMLIPTTQKDLLKFNLEELDVDKTMDFGPEMVADEYRGNGLQKDVLNYLIEFIKKIGYKNCVTTIHPDNIYSINNIEKVGFKSVGEVTLKRGPRIILVMNLRE